MQPQFIPLPPRAKNITGQRFGRLVALGPVSRTHRGTIKWLCRCDCDNLVSVYGADLRAGKTQSCGCLHRQRTSVANTRHGMKNTPIYLVWKSIVQRCTNPQSKNFAGYGGRGIAICGEWRHDFQTFYDHVSNLPNCGKEGYSLDRANNSLGYFPGNIKWSTSTEQNRNKRNNHLLTFQDKTQCNAAWEKELGLRPGTLWDRLNLGWSIERALTTPSRKKATK